MKSSRLSSLLMIMVLYGGVIAQSEETSGNVPESPDQIRPLLIGTKIPVSQLKTVEGDAFDLNAAVAAKPTILIFYRGGW